MKKFILGYFTEKLLDMGEDASLQEFKSEAEAKKKSDDWCVIYANTLEAAEAKYEEVLNSKYVAKLVTVSVTTRVIVPKTAADEQIMQVALPRLVRNLSTDGVLDHLEKNGIVVDTECPYNEENDSIDYVPSF